MSRLFCVLGYLMERYLDPFVADVVLQDPFRLDADHGAEIDTETAVKVVFFLGRIEKRSP